MRIRPAAGWWFLVLGAPVLFAAAAWGQLPAAADSFSFALVEPDSVRPSPHQDSVALYRLPSAWLPVDGLLRVGLGARAFKTVYAMEGDFLQSVSLRDLFLELEYGVWPWLHLQGEVPFRSWSKAPPPFAASGSGLGDARLVFLAGLPRPAGFWGWTLHGGATLPTGDARSGLTEGEVSPEAGLTAGLRLWADSKLPEMRIHLGAGYRWNRNEATGYGVGLGEGFQPWYPRYPAVGEGRPASDNDFLLLGAALEFRQETTSLFLEYTEARLSWADGVSRREFQQFLTAGLRWGQVEGWAVEISYDVSLAFEDYQTEQFTAAYPDLVWHFGLSRQFSLGGRDTDRDGIPDRRDHCPRLSEDSDGFRDDDGCPDRDNDQDGIPDAVDLAPHRAEDRDGFQDEDGLPEPDNDLDGIADVLDDCPDQGEDFDGHHDEDGCPDEFYDRDGDGIEDDRDRCPEAAEDRDGFEDEDGCPDPDNDLDGIEDGVDQCPDEPENYDGIEDDDGCPEEPAGPPPAETDRQG